MTSGGSIVKHGIRTGSDSSDLPWGTGYSGYAISVYASRKPPLWGTVDPDEVEALAKKKLEDHPDAFWYAAGNAGKFGTYWANRNAFGKWKIVPRMLVDATHRTLETTIFGVKQPTPLIIAPIGVQGMFHPEGDLDSARGAAAVGVPYTFSSAATRTPEEVAEVSGTNTRYYQLYWPKSNDITLSLLGRAKKAGYTALIVTLDTMLLGWRPADLKTACLPFIHGWGCSSGLSDPVFMAKHNLQPITETYSKFPYDAAELDKRFKEGDEVIKRQVYLGMEWMKEVNSGRFVDWNNVKFLRENWEGPLILKGIQTVADAETATKSGVDGIVVSNHGGRQVDGALASIDALALIMKSSVVREAQKKGFTILFDSGIRTGPDVIRAIALGANAVCVGRSYINGLILDGKLGVETVLRSLLSEVDTSLGLSGYRSLDEIRGKADEVLINEDKLRATL
ncbi:oxidoreductase [Sistotremastrum suecicum HHB10207 ss-3]|uniref:Oxidoreductase n=1 Tax=Sistotremastrum suecicum HHB10207 ss-3 TaxID=1314776 RepID=A0A166ETH6_9AGAM|nr:oxidoreductase [Sistotremastrum suecicum HHB10207 ss-3]